MRRLLPLLLITVVFAEPEPSMRWTQLPLSACGVDAYLKQYRQRDGRGIVIAILDTGVVPIVFSKGIRAVRVRSEMAASEYALFTDVAVTLVDTTGKAIFKDGFPDRTFDREMDSPGGAAACTLKIVGAFTHAHGKGKAELKIRIDYLYAEPVPIALTRAGNAVTALYPGVPAPLRFSLARAPTAARRNKPRGLPRGARQGAQRHRAPRAAIDRALAVH